MDLILLEKDLLPRFQCLLPVEFKDAADIPGVVLIGAMEAAGLAMSDSSEAASLAMSDSSEEAGSASPALSEAAGSASPALSEAAGSASPASSENSTHAGHDDGTMLPVGIMALSFIHSDELRILWAFVDPDFRGYGIGEAMLEKAFEIAQADGRSRVSARLWGEDDEEAGLFHGDSWLTFHRFMWSGDRYPEWFASLNELSGAKGFGWAHDGDDSHVKPLRKLASPLRNKLISGLTENVDSSWFSDIPISPSCVDTDFSFAYMKDNKCIAALIIERFGSIYYPVAMMQDGDADALRSLIGVALHKLADKENGFLRIAPREDSAVKITQRALEGIAPYNYRMFIAPATAIQDMVREEEAKEERLKKSAELDDLLPEHFEVTGIDYYSGVEV